MTDPKMYTVELGRARCTRIIQDLQDSKDRKTGEPLFERDPHTDCMLYKGKLTSDGHWQIQRRPRMFTRPSARAGDNHHRGYYVHRIAYVALHGADVTLTASHLCGRSNCINPYHIHDESIALNVARINCLGFVDCPTHNHRLATLCQHTPTCIKKPILAQSCCLSLASANDNDDQPAASALAAGAPDNRTPLDEFLEQSQQSTDWPPSSPVLFDTTLEIASPGASPPPPSDATIPEITPPDPESPLSLPAWKATDFDSQGFSTCSEFILDDDDDLDGEG